MSKSSQPVLLLRLLEIRGFSTSYANIFLKSMQTYFIINFINNRLNLYTFEK